MRQILHIENYFSKYTTLYIIVGLIIDFIISGADFIGREIVDGFFGWS